MLLTAVFDNENNVTLICGPEGKNDMCAQHMDGSKTVYCACFGIFGEALMLSP